MSKVPSFKNPFEFDMLMLEPVHKMMETGILIDQEVKKQLQDETLEEWAKAQQMLDAVTGVKDFNAEGKKVVPTFLYEVLGLPAVKKKGKYVADEAAIRTTMAKCADRIAKLKTNDAKIRWKQGYVACHYILKIRGLRKVLSSYLGFKIKKGLVAGERTIEDPDGRIRGTISVGGTETGRFSHSKTLWDTGVNLATIPRKLRKMFIADEGKEMCEVDLNRGESWVYAHLSEDPELLRIHEDGLDFHAETASTISTVFGDALTVDWIIENKDDDAYKIRYLGKKVNHASSYRMKAFKGAETINNEAEDTGITVTVGEFNEARKLWLKRYSMIETWWKEIESQLDRSRTLTTPYGRVHQFHSFWGEDLFKSATAFVPQSTSVDYLNRGFLRVHHELVVPNAYGLQILAQTHDSLLIQYDEGERDNVIPLVMECLTSSLTIKQRTFSIPVEAQYGQSWSGLTGYHPA